MTIKKIAKLVHQNSVNKGFWKNCNPEEIRCVLSKLALIVSEVGEAIEAARNDDIINLSEELADIIIRVLDLTQALAIDIEDAINSKIKINLTRPYMHNKLA